MWATDREPEDGNQPSKKGCSVVPPAWSPGPDPAWLSSPLVPRPSVLVGRRRSSLSDSGDTGIGTYCSEGPWRPPSLKQSHSVDVGSLIQGLCTQTNTTPKIPVDTTLGADDSSSSNTPLTPNYAGLEDDGIPVVRVLPSPSATSRRSLNSSQLNRSPHLSSPLVSPGSMDPKDRKDHRRVRRWSSLTKLPSGPESGSQRPSSSQCYSDRHGSLDRGLPHGYRKDPPPLSGDFYLPLSSSFLCSKHPSLSSLAQGLSSSLAHQAEASTPIQSTLRTQKWLNEQMEYRPKAEITASEPEGPLPWQHGAQHDHRVNQSSLPFNMLVKVKEGLLRQRELEIERQKQQIVQLHARIRENELRVQQVLQSQKNWYDERVNVEESTMSTLCEQTSKRLQRDEELSRKLVMAEWEVLHVNEFFKHITQKYTEDIRKLEEKIKTRDRYITSLKKKRQRESNHNQEKQQRIETLEKYLSELPTLDEVHVGAKQGEAAQLQAEDLEAAVGRLEKSLQEGRAVMKEKDLQIELQAQREKELIASVQSLQQKVQQCLDDGVRVPMQDLKRLEAENRELLQQKDHNSRLFKQQKEQIERLTSILTVTRAQLQKRSLHPGHLKEDGTADKVSSQQQPQDGGSSPVETAEVAQLLKEMSLCLRDLQALCSILIQRAQGKEPSLSLLLGMKSFGVSSEEDEGEAEEVEGPKFGLLEVSRLRRDIDELRKTISDTTLSMWITAVSLTDGRL